MAAGLRQHRTDHPAHRIHARQVSKTASRYLGSDGRPPTRITVDMEKCQHHGQCAIAAPVAFRITDAGELQYERGADNAHRREVEKAVDVCPTQAITLAVRAR